MELLYYVLGFAMGAIFAWLLMHADDFLDGGEFG